METYMPSAITAKYECVLRKNGGLLGTLGRYRLSHLLDAALREVWESLGMRILRFLGRGPATGYGWLEALLSPTADYWLRYAAVIAALQRTGKQNSGHLLEVSSGGWGGMAWALPGRERSIYLVDWSLELLSDGRGGRARRVCADGCLLPFADDSFDCGISIDTLEHLPLTGRRTFLDELKRVSKHTVLVSCPLQSDDGRFCARELDSRLAESISKEGARLPGWLEEHLGHEHPTPKEICEMLPGSVIEPLENGERWWRFASLARKPYLWAFAALAYTRSTEVSEGPYRRALFVWEKS